MFPAHVAAAHADDSDALWEDFVELPKCPMCDKGPLVPLSEDKRPFAIWVCINSSCTYAISNSSHTVFYKGNAAIELKKTTKKEYVQYDF